MQWRDSVEIGKNFTSLGARDICITQIATTKNTKIWAVAGEVAKSWSNELFELQLLLKQFRFVECETVEVVPKHVFL
jgi:hypothetical protein